MTDRTCPECARPVHYGIHCSNDCSDRSYRHWRKDNAEMLRRWERQLEATRTERNDR
jgi:hypothetical protein